MAPPWLFSLSMLALRFPPLLESLVDYLPQDINSTASNMGYIYQSLGLGDIIDAATDVYSFRAYRIYAVHL